MDVVRQQAGDKVNDEQMAQLKGMVERMEFDRDSVKLEAGPMGTFSLNVVEREDPKLVKFQSEGAPVQANLWIQLLPNEIENRKKMILIIPSNN